MCWSRSTRAIVLAVPVLLLAGARDTSAFDGSRRGFMLGFGLGLASSSFEQTLRVGKGQISGEDSQAGLGTTFLIGGGVNDRTWLYYAQHTHFFSEKNGTGDDTTFTTAVGGFGVTHFFQPAAPSWFFEGTVGLSTWGTLDDDPNAAVGGGVSLGGGYELSPHWMIRVLFGFGNPEEEGDLGASLQTDVKTLWITVTGVAY